MSAKTDHVDWGATPVAACLVRVISTVFMHVVKPVGPIGSREQQIAISIQSEAVELPETNRTHSSIRLSNTARDAAQESTGRLAGPK